MSRMSPSIFERVNASTVQETPEGTGPKRTETGVSVNEPTAPLLDKPAGPQRQKTYFEGKEIEATTSKQFWLDVWPYILIAGLNGFITKMVFPALAIKVDT